MINFRKALLWYIAGCATIVATQWLYYTSMPRDHWFDYEAVRFVEVDGDVLVMQSLLEVKRPVDLRFYDILYCLEMDEYHRYSQATSSIEDSEPGVKSPRWRYRGGLPTPPRRCFMRSVINAELPFGIEKSQKIRSNAFEIKPF